MTQQLKGFAATKVSGTHWLGNVANDPLQRVYGIAFPEKRMLTEWQAKQAEVRVPSSPSPASPRARLYPRPRVRALALAPRFGSATTV